MELSRTRAPWPLEKRSIPNSFRIVSPPGVTPLDFWTFIDNAQLELDESELEKTGLVKLTLFSATERTPAAPATVWTLDGRMGFVVVQQDNKDPNTGKTVASITMSYEAWGADRPGAWRLKAVTSSTTGAVGEPSSEITHFSNWRPDGPSPDDLDEVKFIGEGNRALEVSADGATSTSIEVRDGKIVRRNMRRRMPVAPPR